MNTPPEQLSVDDVLAVLSNVQRRKLLDSLLADSPPDGAANAAVGVDSGTAMHHIHLPKLVDHGLVEWDEAADTVTRGPNFEAAEETLEFLAEHDDVLPPGEVRL